MEGIDEAREQEIWQRVQGAPVFSSLGDDLRSLVLATRESAAVYRHLLQTATGKSRELLQELARQESASLACLKGILLLQGEGMVYPEPRPAPKGSPVQLLGRCYHRSRRCLMEYTARSAQPDYGVLFNQLAKRQEEQLFRIVELLGK